MKSSQAAVAQKRAGRTIGTGKPARKSRSTAERSLLSQVDYQYQRWQTEVVAILRHDLDAVLASITKDDVDWPAWHDYFANGKTPHAAVQRALERDL